MKNLILGMLCSVIVVLTILSCLSIYSISSRKNEMDNSVSAVVKQTLKNCYASAADAEAKQYMRQELLARLSADSKVSITVHACDMAQGILSVTVTEEFYLPNRRKKVLRCQKTVIVDAKEEESEGEPGAGEETQPLRFISGRYFEDAAGNLIPEQQGGLSEDSLWAADRGRRSLLRSVIAQCPGGV